jgi:competence protein ComEC
MGSRSPPDRLPQPSPATTGPRRRAWAAPASRSTSGTSPPIPPDPDADPDADGVALAMATAAGVLLGTRFPLAAVWVAAALSLIVACLGIGNGGGRRSRPGDHALSGTGERRDENDALARSSELAGSREPAGDGTRLQTGSRTGSRTGFGTGSRTRSGTGCGTGSRTGFRTHPRDRSWGRLLAGVLVFGTLLAAGGAAASVRATAVKRGVLAGWVGRPGRVEVAGAVAEEPRRVRYGGYWVVLAVDRVRLGGRNHGTRERAGFFLGRSQAEALGPSPGGDGRLAVGDRLRVRASLAAARWSDPLGRQPRVVLRRPVIEERAPPRGAVSGAALRGSELVREAARRRALATLAPERAGLLVGMALGDTSLLPDDLERHFRAAGLTHLMAVSGANLAVVLGAGLWLAGAAGAGRRTLAAVGVVLVVLLVVVTRWEPSVLRAGVMAGLVLFGVATGRGPGGRRALCLAVMVLLLADPALVGALGFQLSVAATAGVLWLGPPVARALPDRIPERVRKALGMTLGAQAAAMPALAMALGPVSLAGLPANVLGLPLAGGPMLLGVVAAVTAPVAPWIATLACRLADPFLVALIGVARWAAGLPGGSVTLTGPARSVPAVAVLLVLLVIVGRRHSPYLAHPADPPPDPERTVRGRDDHRRRAPPGGVVSP